MAKERPLSQQQLRGITQAARNLARLPAASQRQAMRKAQQAIAGRARAGIADEVGQPTMQFYNDVKRILGGQQGLARMLASEAMGGAAFNFGSEVVRYARGGAMSTLLRGALGRLGPPVGAAINFLLGRGGRATGITESAVADAIKLLTGLGFEVRLPSTAPTRVDAPTTRGPAYPSRPEPARPDVGSPGGPPSQRPPEPAQNLPMGSFPGNLPIAMELVQSSNVYAYGYDKASLTLRVQFLGSTISRDALSGKGHRTRRRVRGTLGRTVTGTRRGPGPTYDYHGVPAGVFSRMQSASSKGGAVWDLLRIRGTIYGHQYDYELVAAARADVVVPRVTAAGLFAGKRVGSVTYVPRRAVGPGQFQSRTMQQGSRQFRSLLPSVGIGARGPRT